MSKRGLTPLFSKKDTDRWIDIFQEEAEQKLYTTLQYAGEEFVVDARDNGIYDDHSGNLRSSIGYVISEDGNPLSENFEERKGGKDGVLYAKRLAHELANTYNKGLVLIGVAGMDYAVYVEAIDSKDVITASSKRTEKRMRDSLQKVLNR
jgi:maltoporin